MRLDSQSSVPKRSFPHKQKGVGFAGWLILILVLGTILSIGTKLFPVYMDNRMIEDLVEKLAEEKDVSLKPKAEIYKILTNRLKLNNVRDFDIEEKLEVVRSKGGTTLVLDYEERVSVGGNLDLIASFKKEVELPN